MALEWMIVGAALGAGGMYLAVKSGKVRPNPSAPTYDDLDRNAVITEQRGEHFVHVRGRQIGYWRNFDVALRHARKAIDKLGRDLDLYFIGPDGVMLLDATGEAIATWAELAA